MVAELFEQAQLAPRDLTHIAVTLGPGSFTGLRVGLSFAKGMASGLGIGLRGVGTLEALNAHPALADRRPVAIISGGRGTYYVQHGSDAPRTVTAEGLVGLKADILTGPAARDADGKAYGEVLAQAWPSLQALAALAMTPGHEDVTPLYMRDADAIASTRGIITLEAAS